ncbi:MAG: hypothetical protein E6R03_16415 [Hyphomicrobiaceae bacterium]|nr:MAG: hypothetical protein E6R03_16415 [Hyphomicrobiaceae bacterium]
MKFVEAIQAAKSGLPRVQYRGAIDVRTLPGARRTSWPDGCELRILEAKVPPNIPLSSVRLTEKDQPMTFGLVSREDPGFAVIRWTPSPTDVFADDWEPTPGWVQEGIPEGRVESVS